MGSSSINTWLFNPNRDRDYRINTDHMSRERRKLLNMHLEGELTKTELQEKLRELDDAAK